MKRILMLLALLMLLTGAVAAAETTAADDGIYPLSPTTGLQTDAPYRPVLVLVSNSPEARPHWNLALADIIYETIFWAPNYTRYFALYNDVHPEKVGPVRGARVYNCEWMLGWDAPMAHFGGQDTPGTSIYDFMKANEVPQYLSNDGTRVGKHYHRDADRIIPHNAAFALADYVAQLWPEGEDDRPYEPRLPALRFSKTPSTGPLSVNQIEVLYDDTDHFARYRYDTSNGLYRRDYTGAAQLDADSYKPMQFANVIVEAHEHYFTENNRARPVIWTSGAGKADFYIDGRLTRGLWVRPKFDDPVKYYDLDGNDILLKPGKTFIQVVPAAMYDQGQTITDIGRVTYLNTQYFNGEMLYSP